VFELKWSVQLNNLVQQFQYGGEGCYLSNMKGNGLVTDFCQAEESLLFKSIRESNKGKSIYLIICIFA